MLAAGLFLASGPSHAADFYWNALTGQYETLSNWTTCVLGSCVPIALPGSTDNIFFQLPDSDIQFAIGTTTNSSATLTSGVTTTFDLNTGTYMPGNVSLFSGSTLNVENGLLNSSVELGDQSAINIRNGGNLSGSISIAGGFGSTGTVAVDGDASTWSTTFVNVGVFGNGNLSVTDGGIVAGSSDASVGNLEGSTGVATIDGTGSAWNTIGTLTVGYNLVLFPDAVDETGEGTLNIFGGGSVTNTDGYLGRLDGATGTATVSGAGSTWVNSGFLSVGHGGQNGGSLTAAFGVLNVLGGGSVTNTDGYIGQTSSATGVATVSGIDSTWMNSGGLSVGLDGTGTLNISAGGAVSSAGATAIGVNGDAILDISTGGSLSSGGNSTIAANSGSTGTVTVDGAGSSWTSSGRLIVGRGGSATLEITDGATVASAGGTVAANSGSSGTVTVSGSGAGWVNSADLLLGHFPGIAGTSSTLDILDGASVSNTNANVLQSTVMVSGNGSSWSSSGAVYLMRDPTVISGSSLGVTNGANVSTAGLIVGPGNSITVDGIGSTLSSSAWLEADSLSIANGGQVASVTGSSLDGLVSVAGTGSLWTNSGSLYFGYAEGNMNNPGGRDGTLQVTGGGSVTTANLFLGVHGKNVNGGLPGMLTVDGAGSSVTSTGELYVGFQGDGVVTVSGGASLNSHNATLGYGNDGTGKVTVTGADSNWTNTGLLTISQQRPTCYGVEELWNCQGGGNELVENGKVYDPRDPTWITSGHSSLDIVGGASLASGDTYVSATANGLPLDTNFDYFAVVTVDGPGSTWTNSGSLYLGGDATEAGISSADLNVTDGGSVSIAQHLKLWDMGTVTLDGGSITTGDLDIHVNAGFNFNAGTLTVDGGTITDASESLLTAFGGLAIDSNGAGKTSTLVYRNGATQVLADVISVGLQQTGALEVLSGSQLSANQLTIAEGFGSTGAVTVDGGGSTLDVAGLQAGQFGGGTLNITGGGHVTADFASVGAALGNSRATVDGDGSVLQTTGAISVGTIGGVGVIDVVNDGAVIAGTNLTIGPNGSVNLSGGTIEAGTVDAGTGFFNMTGGTLNADAFIGDLMNLGGTVGPGHSPGIMTVSGDYAQDSTSTLLIEILGLNAGTEYDVLDISGTASLAGTLNVDLFDPGSGLFAPSLGDSFDILMADTLSGSFDSLLFAALGGGLGWDIGYLTDAIGSTDVVRLSVVSAVPVPAAVWLFGSGLVCLIGVARRNKAA